jgi:hypothetical protein
MVESSLRSRVKPPAIALILLAVLGLLYSLFTLVAAELLRQMLQESMAEQGNEVPPFLEFLIAGNSAMDVVLALLNVGVWGFVLFGAVRMAQFRNRSLCVAAALAAFSPTQCCCGLGIAFGIWALVVLNRADVRSAFANA